MAAAAGTFVEFDKPPLSSRALAKRFKETFWSTPPETREGRGLKEEGRMRLKGGEAAWTAEMPKEQR